MKLGARTESDKLYEKISKVKGPGAELRMFNILLTNSLSHLDSQRRSGWDKRVGKTIKGLLRALKEALPHTDPRLIGDFVADVEDLWEYGQKLDEHFKVLLRMTFPKHSEHLRELLLSIKYEQCDESWAHIERLKKSLPQLIKALDRQPPSSGQRAGTKTLRSAKKLALAVRVGRDRFGR
jgi:hypothetical protein